MAPREFPICGWNILYQIKDLDHQLRRMTDIMKSYKEEYTRLEILIKPRNRGIYNAIAEGNWTRRDKLVEEQRKAEKDMKLLEGKINILNRKSARIVSKIVWLESEGIK